MAYHPCYSPNYKDPSGPWIKSDWAYPCDNAYGPGNVVSCCDKKDICMTNGLCRDPLPYNEESQYYVGLCTDRTGKDPACLMGKHCARSYWANIVFRKSSQKWACCYDGDGEGHDCFDPTDETFSAPPPHSLYATASIDPRGFAVQYYTFTVKTTETVRHTKTVGGTHTPKNADSNSENSGGDGNLGKDIGIAVGVAAGIILIALGAFFLWQRRRKPKRHPADGPTPTRSYAQLMAEQPPNYSHHPHEAFAEPPPGAQHADEAGASPRPSPYRAPPSSRSPPDTVSETPAHHPPCAPGHAPYDPGFEPDDSRPYSWAASLPPAGRRP